MQNAAVARIFDDIADYMELAGENIFKIRAYRRASEAVAGLESPIEELAEGGLESVEGLGSATIAKTKEFLATGSVRVLDRLRAEYPPGLLDVLKIPGLGPKKVALLWKERGVDSLEKFIELMDNGGLAGLSGFGPKTIDGLRVGIRRLAEMSARLPLPGALAVGERLVAAMAAANLQVTIAGSVRRGTDTVGNLNLVGICDDPDVLLERFCALPAVLSVTSRHDLSALVKVHPGLEVYLECTLAPASGSRLFELTGSAAHLEQVRALASRSGVDLAGFATEAELYSALGLPFIAPELREGRGELEAAAAGLLPDLVTAADIRGELHAHSNWSDGTATIAQMAEAALARGYEYLAITDHSKALAMANGLNAARLREQAAEIAAAQAEFPAIKLLRGIECDIMRDGSLDLDDDILHELDIVVASVHSAFNLPAAEQTARMVRALAHPAVDIVAHPTGRVLGVRPPYDVDVSALIVAAREYGKALEINASERLDLKDEHAYEARQNGVPLSIDTDAHSPRMLANVSYGITTARRAWCTRGDILNAKSREELLVWLKH